MATAVDVTRPATQEVEGDDKEKKKGEEEKKKELEMVEAVAVTEVKASAPPAAETVEDKEANEQVKPMETDEVIMKVSSENGEDGKKKKEEEKEEKKKGEEEEKREGVTATPSTSPSKGRATQQAPASAGTSPEKEGKTAAATTTTAPKVKTTPTKSTQKREKAADAKPPGFTPKELENLPSALIKVCEEGGVVKPRKLYEVVQRVVGENSGVHLDEGAWNLLSGTAEHLALSTLQFAVKLVGHRGGSTIEPKDMAR